jgi:hypothetical protein
MRSPWPRPSLIIESQEYVNVFCKQCKFVLFKITRHNFWFEIRVDYSKHFCFEQYLQQIYCFCY